MYVKIINPSSGGGRDIVVRCHECGNLGTFGRIQNVHDVVQREGNTTGNWTLGHRLCPNRQCAAHIFFVVKPDNSLITYPSLKIDFNSSNIPEQIQASLEEAISCHSNECYVAAAMMVRRTIEELCEDKQAEGKDLYQRLESLCQLVVLPSELLEALNELRLLGNDAAHIESKDYDNIGHQEVEIAIELTKEILKGIYQLDSLVDKLRALKKSKG